jgi:hypothetical protein
LIVLAFARHMSFEISQLHYVIWIVRFPFDAYVLLRVVYEIGKSYFVEAFLLTINV